MSSGFVLKEADQYYAPDQFPPWSESIAEALLFSSKAAAIRKRTEIGFVAAKVQHVNVVEIRDPRVKSSQLYKSMGRRLGAQRLQAIALAQNNCDNWIKPGTPLAWRTHGGLLQGYLAASPGMFVWYGVFGQLVVSIIETSSSAYLLGMPPAFLSRIPGLYTVDGEKETPLQALVSAVLADRTYDPQRRKVGEKSVSESLDQVTRQIRQQAPGPQDPEPELPQRPSSDPQQ